MLRPGREVSPCGRETHGETPPRRTPDPETRPELCGALGDSDSDARRVRVEAALRSRPWELRRQSTRCLPGRQARRRAWVSERLGRAPTGGVTRNPRPSPPHRRPSLLALSESVLLGGSSLQFRSVTPCTIRGGLAWLRRLLVSGGPSLSQCSGKLETQAKLRPTAPRRPLPGSSES